jgi:hypothetical protein
MPSPLAGVVGDDGPPAVVVAASARAELQASIADFSIVRGGLPDLGAIVTLRVR